MKKWFSGILFVSLLQPAQSQSLSAAEKKILTDIEAAYPATLELLKASVNINSGTFHHAGVRKVGELFRKELEALGFTAEWIPEPDSLNRAGHLVAWRKGTSGKKLFLIGHLDTVFEPDMPPNPFAILNDSTATGQGVNDMKGGDVLIIAALQALAKQDLLKETTITVYFTGDEENTGKPTSVSRADFIQRARQHDIALAFEGAAGLNNIVTARRGGSDWRLEVSARQAHSSSMFGSGGYGSVYEAARIVNEIREKLSAEKYLTIHPSLFIGGSDIQYDTAAQKGAAAGKTNIISPQTVVTGDLRFLTTAQREKARDSMRQIVARHLLGTSARIFFKDGMPAMPPTTGNEVLRKKLSEISLALGYGEVAAGDPGSRGAGDISFVAEWLDCLDGLGASGKGAHAPGETLNLREYPKLIKRTALLIYRLTR